jgi:hypothetical protein
MRPQYFPWLFDDKSAWEKSLGDNRYSYDLPMDYFMGLYSVERKAGGNVLGYSLPSYLPSVIQSAPVAPVAATAPATSVFSPMGQKASAAEAPKEESKLEEGILSQEEIDALLSGL